MTEGCREEKTGNRIARTLLLALIIGLVVCNLPAAEQSQRYIVILKQRAGAVPDVASLGGVIESRQDEQLVVTIPAASLAALKADQKVRYIERVGGQPSAAEEVLIGEPADPQPRLPGPSKRLVPHALGNTPWDSGLYAYDGAGDIVTIGTDNYLYDGAQRLKQSSTKGTGETYTYDGLGNMKSKGSQTYQVDPTTNRYVGYLYNEAGAVTADGSYTFSYDPVGQPLSKIYGTNNTTQEYYLYTASDERIGVQRGGWWTWSVRDQSGKVLRQYKSSVTNPSGPALWLEDYVWRDGLLLGSQRPVEMGGRRHFHLDHLGTPRLVTSDNGQMVSYHDYFPFGDEKSLVAQEGPSAGGFDREEPLKFTGHERDYAGGMGGEDGHAVDYMHARLHNPGLGRFLSVDPIIPSAAVKEPQRWNRYAYVSNNPIKNTDPTGKSLEARASACSDRTDKCYTRLDAYQALKDWVGRDAANYLQLGKNGQVTLKGISAANFIKLGGAAAIVGNLIRSTSSTAALSLSANVTDDAGRPTSAFTRSDAKGTLTEINPAMFPRIEGGATQTMDTALAHDLGGHGLQDMWGISPFNKAYGSIDQRVTFGAKYGEAFAITMENIYRASQGMDIRGYYMNPYDYDPPKP